MEIATDGKLRHSHFFWCARYTIREHAEIDKEAEIEEEEKEKGVDRRGGEV